ncbi:MAG: LysM peptidoglycan-binding domain-containing protein [Proteobacteria bacterium]|nr:LysM peptidoglycan-binding domain-containing protein [Pseudomonadota bacterium]
MVSNQVLGWRPVSGLLILSLALTGCSHFRHHEEAAPAPAQAAAPVTQSTPAAPEMTATEAAIAAGNAAPAAPADTAAAPDTRGMVNPDAPAHYTVKRGDTLWGIASMYLKDPWLWPEVWVINPQVVNPHLIYPGDQLALTYGSDGRPQVVLEQGSAVRLDPRLRSSELDAAIPTIPYSAIAAFLGRPTIMSKDEIRNSPYVVAFRDDHQVAGTNNEAYIRDLPATPASSYAVVHIAGPLVDPDDHSTIAYEAIYVSTAQIARPGDPAKAILSDPARETLRGDRLVSGDLSQTPMNFTPRAPASQVRGQIIDVVGGTDLVGQYQIVAINRGHAHGVEPGTVLAIDEAGYEVSDVYRNSGTVGETESKAYAPKVMLPEERVGTVLVFKTYDRMSYALVVNATDTIHINYVARSP